MPTRYFFTATATPSRIGRMVVNRSGELYSRRLNSRIALVWSSGLGWAVVITVATMEAGTAANQIAGEAVMRGTMRTLKAATCDEVEESIHRVAAGVALSYGVQIEVALRRGNPVTQNTPAERDLAAEAVVAAGLPLRRDMLPAMTGEDFAWYLQQRPGAFVWIGNGPTDGGRELHNSNYDYNDAILPAAAGYLASVAKRALGA